MLQNKFNVENLPITNMVVHSFPESGRVASLSFKVETFALSVRHTFNQPSEICNILPNLQSQV